MVKINAPYNFTVDEQNCILENFVSHKDWYLGAFDQIKENLIKHLRVEQRNKCAYCKKELGFDLKDVDVDHIIPKSKFEMFTFHPKNLTLSCPGCNTSKGSQDVHFRDFINYPRSGANIKIVHSHFDTYEDCIEVFKGCVFIPRNSKGCETIRVCKLFRLREVAGKAKSSYLAQSESLSDLEHLRETRDSVAEDGLINRILGRLRSK